MADIFVSYKKEDRPLVEGVVSLLEQLGYSVWWDQRLTPVESWDTLIENEINEAKAVLVLWTSRSVGSEWVRAEADYAKERKKIVPAKLEACNLPLAFRLTQCADLSLWGGDLEFPEWQRTLSWISTFVGQPPLDTKLVSSKEIEAKNREEELEAEIVLLRTQIASLVTPIDGAPVEASEVSLAISNTDNSAPAELRMDLTVVHEAADGGEESDAIDDGSYAAPASTSGDGISLIEHDPTAALREKAETERRRLKRIRWVFAAGDVSFVWLVSPFLLSALFEFFPRPLAASAAVRNTHAAIQSTFGGAGWLSYSATEFYLTGSIIVLFYCVWSCLLLTANNSRFSAFFLLIFCAIFALLLGAIAGLAMFLLPQIASIVLSGLLLAVLAATILFVSQVRSRFVIFLFAGILATLLHFPVLYWVGLAN